MPRQWVIAGAFGLGWLLLLLAGSDFPPPPGFLWAVVVIGVLVGVIGAVVPRLWRVQDERGSGPVVARCLAAGAGVGVILTPVLTVLNPPDPSTPDPTTAAFITWVLVLTFVGSINGALVGGVTALMRPRD